jgi:putative ABC transport system permease protein
LVLSLFAAAGTTVAGAGMVTIVAFVVARQTREFAIRIALGATHSNILRLAASEAMIGALLGGAGGLLLGRWLSGWLRSLVFGIEPGNWTTALTSSGLSFLIMAVAAVIAARRTLRLEPARALSME